MQRRTNKMTQTENDNPNHYNERREPRYRQNSDIHLDFRIVVFNNCYLWTNGAMQPGRVKRNDVVDRSTTVRRRLFLSFFQRLE